MKNNDLSIKELTFITFIVFTVTILMFFLINKTLNNTYRQADIECKKELTCKPGNVSTYVYRNGCMCIESK